MNKEEEKSRGNRVQEMFSRVDSLLAELYVQYRPTYGELFAVINMMYMKILTLYIQDICRSGSCNCRSSSSSSSSNNGSEAEDTDITDRTRDDYYIG